jgi:hypothetical protein
LTANKFTVSIPGHTFGPFTQQQASNAINLLRQPPYNYTPIITPLESRIDFRKIEPKQDRNTPAHDLTKQVLLTIFPAEEYNKPRSSAEVLDILYKTPGTITGSHLHEIRKELNIQSRSVKIKGISGTAYWEWVRIKPPKPHE